MITWKESAQEEVRVIYEYLLDQSFAAADDWSDQLERKLALLDQFPEMGRIVPDLHISFIREIFVGSYRVVYSTQEPNVKIIAVRPMSRPLGKL
ncbi:type II toxin-antitoxin system RelE/ParE family toxin [Spirosoma rhododendri]|uniref:Type II toxin-antitoxin system RelE/ParE family toxin n=1 Tax=Spirosoma rhododendri TaxID=2728024 RepID=A0A7L5DN65_9BACT|nr:type II toxin-antitoxin system RelE/ParE family toxin [Spirosoma rhododendri]QJD78921.1 type II toxin-antitoxin system RelE/ParE family toxin [Spirosoma rhododendri]